MTEMKLASAIAKIEGKKSQVHIGNVREIIKIIQVMIMAEVKNSENTGELPVLNCLFRKAKTRLEKEKKTTQKKAKRK